MPPEPRIYGGLPDKTPGKFDGQLLAFADDLRSEGIAIGTSEMLDAFAALEHIAWTNEADFRETLAATLAKSPEDRRGFELGFERFFFPAARGEAPRRQVTEGGPEQPGAERGELEIDLETLRRQIAQALQDGSDGALRDLAR